MSFNEIVTYKHSKEVREAMRLLKAEYVARKKLKLLANGGSPTKEQPPIADAKTPDTLQQNTGVITP